MVKFIALFRKPQDTKTFDDHYFNIHLPLAKKLPGLKRLEVSKITGTPIGEPKHYLIAELYFDSKEAMDSAMASSEGKASARDLMSFAADLVTFFHAEIHS